MACQRYRKFVFTQKKVVVKKKWNFSRTEGQAVLFRAAEMQSFAAAGNDKFTCKGEALQSKTQMIPSLRAVQIPSPERSAEKLHSGGAPCLGRAAVTASKAVRDLGSRILVLIVTQYLSFEGEAAF